MGKGNKVYRMLQFGEERTLRDGGDTSCDTAGSCFFEKGEGNRGLWEFEEGFLYRIYTKRMWIWGCDMVEK